MQIHFMIQYTSQSYITLFTECHGTYRCYNFISNIYAVYVIERLDKYQYLGLMRSGTLQTCLRVSMHRLTTKLSNRQPSRCMVWPTLAHIWSPTYQILKTLTLYWIFTQRKISQKLSHINDMGMTHGQESAMVVLQSQSVTVTAASWTLRRTIRSCSLSAAHTFPRLAWAERCCWVSASRPCSLTTIVTSQHLSIATIQRQLLLFMTHTTKPGHTTTCSGCCQSSGWTFVKNYYFLSRIMGNWKKTFVNWEISTIRIIIMWRV